MEPSSENTESMANHGNKGQLGGWRLGKPLGAACCSEVYLAHSIDDSDAGAAPYVVKVVPPSAPSWAKQMIANERHVLTQVIHPNIVSLLDAGQERGCRYLVLPFLEGVLPLDRQRGPIAQEQWSRVAWIGRQVVDGLTAIHAAGWAHGDLKPVHVSVDRFLHVTLLDFGMAQRLYQPRATSVREATRFGAAVAPHGQSAPLIGSPPYMAPEAFLEQQPVTPAQDVYSLGCLLYNWFTGVRPFEAQSVAAWKQAHVSARPMAPTEWVPELPLELSQLLLRMLAKQPARRPALDEVAALLVRLELAGFGDWLQPPSRRGAA